MGYQTLLLDMDDGVGLLRLNRPEALNALNSAMIAELGDAVAALDQDDGIGAIVITGSQKAFAAGADVKEMADKSFAEAVAGDLYGAVLRPLLGCRKPLIAAVNGYALGGGCELAMLCDIAYAGTGARFGLPEVKLGIIPGMGGTQRLVRAVGKAKAMDMILSGHNLDAEQALAAGLVAQVFPADDLVEEVMKIAKAIAQLSRPAVLFAKEAVNRAQETPLAEGLLFERRAFHALFATEDQKEGMQAFIDKRKPNFKNC